MLSGHLCQLGKYVLTVSVHRHQPRPIRGKDRSKMQPLLSGKESMAGDVDPLRREQADGKAVTADFVSEGVEGNVERPLKYRLLMDKGC